MFKPLKGYDGYSNKSFRLPTELIEQLETCAYKYNLSLNQFVIQCLKYAIDNLETDEHNEKNNISL